MLEYYERRLMSRELKYQKYFKENHPTKTQLSEYVTSKTKIKVRCNLCNIEWETIPFRVRCAGCGHKRLLDKITFTHEEYLKSVPETIQVLEKYTSMHVKILHQCNQCNHQWSTKPMHIKRGRGCPKCGVKKNKKGVPYSHEKYISLIADRLTILEEYKGVHVKILHKCNQCGHQWKVKPCISLRYKCPKRCSPESEYVNKLPENITLLDKFQNFSIPAKHICDKGHIWNVMPKDLLRSKGCKYCNSNGISEPEQDLGNWIKSLGFEIKTNDRSIISPLELDVVIESKKLAIEFNGRYWHSLKDNSYHLNKTIKCENKNYRLIHIWQHEPDNEIIRSIIKNALGVFDRIIQARKCIVQKITWAETKDFLNKNHIQGEGAATPINLALIYQNEIVAVMTFSPPRFKNINTDWELVRYAVSINTTILGGAFKLFKQKPSGSIMTYSDRRLFDGKLYERLGFKKDKINSPSYFHVNNSGIVLNRYQTQKKKLQKLLGEKYEPSLSETENMRKNDFFKIYDSGTVRWLYT